ncbi:MAG: hypothetical protein Q4G70_16050, partial [Pseudomonadota bacterium]|nr:hypothetical protein [Pseudomonadota bacterium]
RIDCYADFFGTFLAGAFLAAAFFAGAFFAVAIFFSLIKLNYLSTAGNASRLLGHAKRFMVLGDGPTP